MNKEKWICGWSEDNWDGYDEFDTKEEAIGWGRDEYQTYDVEGFFVGVKKPYIMSSNIIDAETVLERINDSIYDDIGEYAEDYLMDIEKEQKDKLGRALNKVFHLWIKKYNLEPTFFEVFKVEGVDLIESEDEK